MALSYHLTAASLVDKIQRGTPVQLSLLLVPPRGRKGLAPLAFDLLPRYAPREVERLALGPDAVPALLVRPDAPGRHPAVLLQHGLGAEKADLLPLGTVLAAYGAVVLMADAWGHGERASANGANGASQAADYFFDVMRHTLDDMRIGVSALLARPDVREDAVLAGGFSMGAMAALVAGTEDPRVAGVVSIAGSPLPDMLDNTLFGAQTPSAAARAYAHEHDVVANIARLAPRPLLLSQGRRDNMVPVGGTLRLYEAAKPVYADHPDRLALQLYDHTHHITEEQMRDALGFIAPLFLSDERDAPTYHVAPTPQP